MRRKPNKDAREARVILERYGAAQRTNLYKRVAAERPFGLFVIDGKLSIAEYPSPRCSGLQQDMPLAVVGIYTEMPTWSQLVEDLDETEKHLSADRAAVSA